MDTLPLDHNPPRAPRNLTRPLAAWLRQMGFTVLEMGGVAPTALEATWRGPDGLLFQASYAYKADSGGIFQLLGIYGKSLSEAQYKGLVHRAEVNRPREVRFLLLSNVFYADARRQALLAGTLLPAHAQPTA